MAPTQGPLAAAGQPLRSTLRRRDFLRVSKTGRRQSTRLFLVYGLQREDQGPIRLGITVTRKVGNAVRRNRIKRLVREWFRQRRESVKGLDLVIIAKREFPSDTSQADVDADLDEKLGRDCSRLLP